MTGTQLNATIKINNGREIKTIPVNSYKNIEALKFSVECMLNLYAGSRDQDVECIHTETSYPDGSVEKGEFLCYKGKLIPDAVMNKLRVR